MYIGIEELVGKIFKEVKNNGDEIIFIVNDDEQYKMYHDQDCCESVCVEDIVGDLTDLIGTPIKTATEDTNSEDLIDPTYTPESFTWTFYNIATIKGHVTIRWYGESNGYYSESVSFTRI